MIGIELIGTGEFLDLFDDTAIDLKQNNPIFADDDIIPGSISLPFDVPGAEASPRNAKLLKNPDVIGNISSPKKYSARLWYDGNPYKTGVIMVLNGRPDKISLKFNFGLTTIADDFKKKKIRDIVDNVVTISATSFTKKLRIQLLQFIGVNHTITINGVAFEFQQYGAGGAIINGLEYPNGISPAGTNESFADAINNTITDPPVSATYAAGYFEIQPINDADKIETPLKVQVDELNYVWYIAAPDIEADYNTPIVNWLNTNFYSAAPSGTLIKDALRFPMVRNKLYDNSLFNSPRVNFVKDAGGYVLNKPVDTSGTHQPSNESSICPKVRWKWVLDQLLDYFGLTVEGDFYGDTDFSNALIPHSNSLDILVPLSGSIDWVACAREFNIKDFVPDFTVPEFLKALQKKFNLAVYLNERTGCLRIKKREALMAAAPSEVNDISSLCAPIEDNEPQEITGIRLKAIRDTKNLISVDDQFERGDPNLEIVTEISGWTEMFGIRDHLGATKYIMAGASRLKDSGIPAAMIFYKWKLTGDAAPFNYPSANINGDDGVFAFAGATGMVEREWTKYLRFLANRKKIPTEVSYELRHLIGFDWERKVSPMEGLNCFVATINTRLTMHAIERSKVELWSCDLGV